MISSEIQDTTPFHGSHKRDLGRNTQRISKRVIGSLPEVLAVVPDAELQASFNGVSNSLMNVERRPG